MEISSLQRQIIRFSKDITSPKVHSAADKMQAINPDIKELYYEE